MIELIHKTVAFFFDFILHLDRHLEAMVQSYGSWVYLVLFTIVFCETGLVVTPFLPGDSLLFVAGTLAAVGGMNIWVLLGVLAVAAILGDTVNYWVGHYIGPKVFHYKDSRFFKKEYLDRTHAFYEKHGGKTIILARFVPIIRTFAPFVAGVGKMTYGKFITYNVVGGLVWVISFVTAGYFFGNIPVVKKNLTVVVIVIIIISVMPGVVEYIRHRRAKRQLQVTPAAESKANVN
jgi:membrane-associated protein